MCPEIRMPLAILARRAQPCAVRQDRLQLIEVGPPDIGMLVHNQPSQLLPHPLAHNSGLPVVYLEALFQEDSCGLNSKPLDSLGKILPTRESQVVRIAGVFRSRCPG